MDWRTRWRGFAITTGLAINRTIIRDGRVPLAPMFAVLPDAPTRAPHPAVVDASATPRLPGYLEWKSSAVVDQRQDLLSRCHR